MSAKTLESAVRELTKTVLDLQEKVSSLEKHVIDQKSIINKLMEQNVNSSMEGRQIQVPLQLPPREARVRALKAINTKTSKTQERNNSPLTLTVPSSSAAAAGASSQTSRSEPSTPSTSDVLVPLQVERKQVERKQSTQAKGADAGTGDDASSWIAVKPRRKRRSIEKVTRGTAAPGSTTLSAADRKSYLHLYYVKSGTTADEVNTYLGTICPEDKCSVETLQPRGDYASFKLSVPTKHVDKYLAPQYWAEDVHVKPWRSGFRKPTQQTK